MRMRSYQVCECGAPLQLAEGDTPAPQGTQVLMKVLAAGVCHSDLHIWDGYYEVGGGRKLNLVERGIKLPLTMGHENVGEVIAVGPEASGVKVGDVRLVNPWIGCGECKVCRRGDENLCVKPQSIGVYRQGGYSTHLLVPHSRHLFDIGRLSPRDAAPLRLWQQGLSRDLDRRTRVARKLSRRKKGDPRGASALSRARRLSELAS